MDAVLVFFLLYDGGFVLAVVFMLLATFRRRQLSRLLAFVALSFFCLMAQGGCWFTAAGIGRATGGGGGSGWFRILLLGVLVCAIWAAILFISRVPSGERTEADHDASKPETFDY